MDCIGSPTRNTVRPSPGCQPAVSRLEQLPLRLRGVLELVHQDVADLLVERQQQLARIVGGAERAHGAFGDLREVDAVVAGRRPRTAASPRAAAARGWPRAPPTARRCTGPAAARGAARAPGAAPPRRGASASTCAVLLFTRQVNFFVSTSAASSSEAPRCSAFARASRRSRSKPERRFEVLARGRPAGVAQPLLAPREQARRAASPRPRRRCRGGRAACCTGSSSRRARTWNAASRYRADASSTMPGCAPKRASTGTWRVSEAQNASMVRMRRRCATSPAPGSFSQHALAHLGRRLARERDGEDFLGLLRRWPAA